MKKEVSKNTVKEKNNQATQQQKPPATSSQQNHSNSHGHYSSTLVKEKTDSPQTPKNQNQKGLTRIIIKYDVGFPNFISIRGKGANLNWQKGANLKNVGSDEWVWEIESPFNSCEFKVLINDQFYEIGENHYILPGATLIYTPQFPS